MSLPQSINVTKELKLRFPFFLYEVALFIVVMKGYYM